MNPYPSIIAIAGNIYILISIQIYLLILVVSPVKRKEDCIVLILVRNHVIQVNVHLVNIKALLLLVNVANLKELSNVARIVLLSNVAKNVKKF